jgi:hypothetical protein
MTIREAAGRFRRLEEADAAYPSGTSLPPRDEWFFCKGVLDYVWVAVVAQERYAAATRYYAEIFTAEPQFLAGPQSRYRYQAACAAALAGCGQGRDAADLDASSRAAFRRQALDWLRAELEAQCRLLELEPERPHGTIADDLQRWLGDTPFAGVRQPEALSRLPKAERQAWQRLWADVADTLARAEGRIPPPPQTGGKVPLPER